MSRCAVISALGFGSLSYAEDLKTTDGRHFRQFKVVQVDPNGVFVRHSKGMAKIHFDDLNGAMRKRFGYDESASGRFDKGVPEEPPARPAPPPGGLHEPEKSGNSIGPIMASVQYNAIPSACRLAHVPARRWNPYPYGMLVWRQQSLHNLLAASRMINRAPRVAPWQWGGYTYPYFRR